MSVGLSRASVGCGRIYWEKYCADRSRRALGWGVAGGNSIVAVVIGHDRGRGWRLFGGNLAAFSRWRQWRRASHSSPAVGLSARRVAGAF